MYTINEFTIVNDSLLIVIDGNEIVYRDYVDISCAVATPKVSSNCRVDCHGYCIQGLVVPILRDVQKMSFADVEKELNALAAKVKPLWSGLV